MNVWLKITRPVSLTSIPGNLSLNSSGDMPCGLGNPAAFPQIVFARKLHIDVDARNRAVACNETRCKTGLGKGNRANAQPFFGVVDGGFADKVANQYVVPACGRVLEVRKGIDAGCIRNPPGPFRQPCGRFEGIG